MSVVLTFDLGTTFFKACLFDEAGRLLALARRDAPVETSHFGWRQIGADTFVNTLTNLVTDLKKQDAPAFTRASIVSFATQTNSFLLLDEHHRPLTPIILWNDRRAESLDDQLQPLSQDPAFRHETGLPQFDTQFAAAKLLWLQEHEPGLWERARRFCLIGDYLVWWLTGKHVTEGGAAGLTGLLNIHTLTWRPTALTRLGMTHLSLPTPRYAGSDLGTLRPEAANRLGLSPACRGALGCLDQYAGAIGAGNMTPGGLSETTGTVLATVMLSDTFDSTLPAAVFQGPAWQPGLWWRMRFESISGNLLETLRQQEPDAPSYELLNAEAATVPAGADGLRLDTKASAQTDCPVFVNLQPLHTRGHRVRAVFEAVAEALREQVHDLRGDAPAGHQIHAVGGAARSPLWLEIKTQIVGVPVIAIDCPEPTSLGAARIGSSTLTGKSLTDTARQPDTTIDGPPRDSPS